MPRHSICLRLHGNAIVVRAVVRFVFKVAERECPCAEAVLFRKDVSRTLCKQHFSALRVIWQNLFYLK